MWLAAACLLSSLAGEPQCSTLPESCVIDVSDGLFANAWNSLRLNGQVDQPSMVERERDALCSLNSWVTAEQCHERCNFRLEITQPADLRLTVCLVDNNYPPYAPDAHIDLHHPLNGVEHDIVNISASASSCSLSGNANVSGKIALQGSTCYDSSVARTARAGGAVMSIKTSSYKYNRVKQTFSSWGSGWGLDSFPSAVMPRHHSLLLWEALERGAAVRGRVVLSCDALPQLSATSAADLGDGCPSPRMAGMCNEMLLPQDRLCSRCPLELRVAGVAVCLWGNTLLPRKAETLLQNTAQLPLATAAGEVVVASDLPDNGCSASDYTQLSGKIVVVQETRSCLPFTQVRMAQAQGVRAVLMAPRTEHTFITAVEGPSLGVSIPVHAMDYANYTALKAASEQAQVVPGVGSMPGAGELAVGGPVASRHHLVFGTLKPKLGSTQAIETLPTWEWNAMVAVCVVLIAVEVLLLALLFAHQHTHTAQLPEERGSSGVSVPLGLASMGLSLSLLVIVAVVAFILTSAAGQESTDTAVQDGRAATLATYANAVQNAEDLSMQLRGMIVERSLESLRVFVERMKQSVSAYAVVMMDFDGTWASFSAAYPKFQKLSGTADRGGLLTTNGFYARPMISNDVRTESQRGDGVPGDVITNNTGFPYGLVYGMSDSDWETFYYPTARLNYSNVMGNAWRSPLSLFNRSSSPSEQVWFVSRRTSDTYPINDPLHHMMSVFLPFFNSRGQYWGSLEGTTELLQFGLVLQTAMGTLRDSLVSVGNMTALIVDRTDGAVLGDSRGNNVYTEALFIFLNPVWFYERERHVNHLHTTSTMPSVHVKALGNYLDKQENGWVEHNGEFDQQAEWSHQHLYLAKLRAAGGAVVDESGEDVKAESRGGRCGTCTVMDSNLGREVFVFDGDNVLHIYNNLTVGASAVAKTRTSPVGQAWASDLPEYAESIVMSDGTECVARRPPGGGALGCYVRPAFTLKRHYTISMRVRPDDVAVNRQVRGAQLFSQTFEGETNVRVFADGEMSVNVLGRGCRVRGVPGGLPVGKWSTVTVVTTRISVAFACTVYIDGRHHATSFYSRHTVAVLQRGPYYAGRHFHGRMDNLMLFRETLTATEVMSLHTAGKLVRDVPSKPWFVATKAMSSVKGQSGTEWSVVTAVPREDIMRQVDDNNRVTINNLAVQEDNTNKKLERRTNETVLVIVVIALFSVGVFLVFNSMLTRPFARYAVLMTEAAVMKVDEMPEGESFIRELRAMNRAMRLMLSNLKEYKSYMPLSLQLAGQTEDEYEDDTEQALSASLSNSRNTLHTSLSTSFRSVSSVGGHASMHQGLMCALTKKRFSLVVLNLKEWHNTAATLSDMGIVDLHGSVLHCVLAVFNSNKGISEVFSGDRFASTFNAAKVSTSHRVCAASSAYHATTAIDKLISDSEHSISLSTSASAVSGEGRVGNMGNDLMKRFTCVSPVMTWGYALERFCGSLGTRVMADASIYEEASHSFRIMIADAVEFPKRHLAPINVALVLGITSAAVDEWMYELEEAAKSDPFREWNEWALRAFLGTFDNEKLKEFANKSYLTVHTSVFDKMRYAAAMDEYVPARIAFH